MFGKLNDIKDNANKGKQSADAAYFTTKLIQEKLGKDKTPIIDEEIEDIKKAVAGIEESVTNISTIVSDTTATQEMLDILTNLANQFHDEVRGR